MPQPSGCLGLLLKLFGVAPKSGNTSAYPFGVRDDFLSAAEAKALQLLKP